MKQPPNMIGFIGGGNMGSSLISGLIQHGYSPQQIILADHQPEHCKQLKQKWNITIATHNSEVAAQSSILVLAVKPQSLREVVEEIASHLDHSRTLLLSIAAGITTTQLQRWAGSAEIAIIRAMPNTPALYQQGISGLFATSHVSAAQREAAEQLLNAVGRTVWIDQEPWMDIVTALSGSGPAYFYYVMEGLIKGAQALGLPHDIARELTIYTALGSAQLALRHPHDLNELREQVTSKGGTTEQGINALKDGKLLDLLANALKAASLRGKTLSQEYD